MSSAQPFTLLPDAAAVYKITLLCEAVCTLHTNFHYRVIYPACFSPCVTRLGVNQKHQIPAFLMNGQYRLLLSGREKNSSGKRDRSRGAARRLPRRERSGVGPLLRRARRQRPSRPPPPSLRASPRGSPPRVGEVRGRLRPRVGEAAGRLRLEPGYPGEGNRAAPSPGVRLPLPLPPPVPVPVCDFPGLALGCFAGGAN